MKKIVPQDLSIVLKSELSREILFNSNPSAIAAVGLVMEDYSKVIHKVETPTNIVWGEDDDVAPIRTAYVLNKLIKNSSLNIIKNSSHVPIIEKETEFMGHLKNFLENKSAKIQKESNSHFKDLKVSKQKDVLIQGDIDYLLIEDSFDIVIKNSNIKNLKIINSKVEIIDSNFHLKDSIQIDKSKVNFTSSDIFSKKDLIIFNQSKLDFAGCFLTSDGYALEDNGIKNSSLVFSITKISSKLNNKIFHESFLSQNKKNF